ncbi:MAG: GNAT family N-acetyltransferase [Pseudomonadota bacterium]
MDIKAHDPGNHALRDAIRTGLDQANAERMQEEGLDPAWQQRHELLYSVEDAAGDLTGGLIGDVKWGWLYVAVLWVRADQRGTGLGGKLLAQAEADAIALGAQWAYLSSMTIEAPDYYPRHGYEAFTVLEDFPPGGRRPQSITFLRKRLIPVGEAA